MIDLMAQYLPLYIIFLTLSVSFIGLDRKKMTKKLVIAGFLAAILVQTLFIVWFDDPHLLNWLAIRENPSLGELFSGEFIFILCLVLFLMGEEEVSGSQGAKFYPILHLLVTIGAYFAVISHNVVVILFSLVVLEQAVYYLFFYGPYRKGKKLVRNFNEAIQMTIFFLLICLIAVLLIYMNFTLEDLDFIYVSAKINEELLVYIGFLLIFALVPGVLGLYFYHLSKFHQNASRLGSRLFTVLLTPLFGLLMVRFLRLLILNSRLLGWILIAAGAVGIIVDVVAYFTQIQNSQLKERAKLGDSIGLLANMDFQIFLLLLGCSYLTFFNKDAVVEAAYAYFLYSTCVNLLAALQVSPLLRALDRDYYLKFPKLKANVADILAIVIVPLLLAIPGAPGNLFLQNLLDLSVYKNPYWAIDTAGQWATLILIIGVIGVRLFTFAHVFNKYYYIKTTKSEQEGGMRDSETAPSRWFVVASLVVVLLFSGVYYLYAFDGQISIAESFFGI